MATTTCVKLKCEVKDIFDKALKQDVLEQVRTTIQTLIDGTKGLKFDPKCKDGWELNASVVSLTVDDPNKPTTIEAKVAIDGIHLQGSLKVAKSTGSAKATGSFRAKNIAKDAKLTVHDALEDLMNKRVLPALTP